MLLADPGRALTWDRDSQTRPSAAGESTCCLFRAGFIANRHEIADLVDLERDADDQHLLTALYARYGEEAPRRIAGPFSWALWDERRGRLVAAAERTGQYRIYYSGDASRLVLAGCVEEILARVPAVADELNPRAAVAHLCGLPPPVEDSFYRAVRALAPGGLLVVDRGAVHHRHYWRAESTSLLRLGSDQEYAAAFRELFFPLVEEYLPDGEPGITLSGGLDSTSVAVGLRRSLPGGTIHALRWVAPELKTADEDRLSAAVARRLKLVDIPIDAGVSWTLSAPDGIRTRRSSPFYNHYTELWEETLSRTREAGVRHLFTGASGDHLFGGNVWGYPDLLLTGRWWVLARQLREHLPNSEWGFRRVVRRMILGPALLAAFPRWRRFRRRPVPWLRPAHLPLFERSLADRSLPGRLLPGRALRLQNLRDPRLVQVNEAQSRQAAELGIELRQPLNDHRLVEFAARLPTDQTFRAAVRKIIVRNAMRGELPAEIVERRTKIYPAAISLRGLRERETAKVWDLLTGMRAADLGLVEPEPLRRHYRAFLDGETDDALFWHTLSLEDWLRRYF